MPRILHYGNHRLAVEGDISLTEVKQSLVEIFPETKHAVLMEDASGKITVVPHQQVLQNKLDIALNNRVDEVIEEAVERAEQRRAKSNQITYDKIQTGTIEGTHIAVSHADGRTPYFRANMTRTEYEAAKARAEGFQVQMHSNSHMGYSRGTRDDKKRELFAYYDSTKSTEELEYINHRLDQILGKKKELEYPYVVGERYAERGNYAHLVGKSVKSILHDELIGVHVVKPEEEDKEYVIRESDLKLEE